MSVDSDDDGWPHPREVSELIGHAEAERTVLDIYRSGRMPHAWLIGGPSGIGKTTLAYRIARFVLANPDAAAPELRPATSLAVAPEHPVAQRIAAQAHPDLLVLKRVINEKTGKLYTVIRVEDVRRTSPFFGSTAGEGGWRVCLVDNADELQYPNAANTLLKILEEPPAHALLLLVSHAPARLLPTIRSRCRRLLLRPLTAEQVAEGVARSLGRDADDEDIREAAAHADGSIGRALALLEGPALELRRQVLAQLQRLPAVDPRALHALGEALAGTEPQRLAAFVDTVNQWLAARTDNSSQEIHRLVRLADAWERINQAARDAHTYNLDRKPLVFSVFNWLAEAART
ncbi:MAG: DNA polymerase III subunit delta' [Hyphomicrobiales bacterium]|nr:DNA polymerase III subunit delta' [Hyphomicrobiales bacterium]